MKIEAFFSNMKEANEAVHKLKSSGMQDAFVDLNDHYMEERNVKTNLPGTELSTSLSGLVLESDAHGIGERKSPLNAASPMVSGMGNFEEIAEVQCRVVVNTPDGSEEKVRQIMKDGGGTLENPFVKKPKLKDAREIELYNVLDQIKKGHSGEGFDE